VTSMAAALADVDRLAGDIRAYQYLLDEMTADRDRLARVVQTLQTQLDTATARAQVSQ